MRAYARPATVLAATCALALGWMLTFAAVPAAAQDACVKSCKDQRRSCLQLLKSNVRAFKTRCKTLGNRRAVRLCKKAGKAAFRENKRECKRLFSDTCKPCCLQGNGTCSVAFAGGQVFPGGTTSSDAEGDGTSASDPVEVVVETPNAGNVSIAKTPLPFGTIAPAGVRLLGVRLVITAPVAAPGTPLVLRFEIDASQTPPSAAALDVFQDRVLAVACGAAGVAAPDPCVQSRERLPSGSVRVTVLSTSASIWTVGERLCGNGILDSGEQCDGGACCSASCTLAQRGSLCREGGDCDVFEFCTGTSAECPPDRFVQAGRGCSDDGLFCTGDEVCDGSGHCVSRGDPCPGTDCRTCQEASNSCVAPEGTPCTDDGLFCNGVEQCDGAGNCFPSGNPCAGGECNTCQETTNSCFDPAGTACGADASSCTLDVCNGSGACTHPVAPGGTLCRPVAGACDIAERCDGVTTACPADAFLQDVNAECRPSAGVCDAAEFCDGSGAECPADVKRTAVECRPKSTEDVCDVAEFCDGVRNNCPPDGFAPVTQECRPSVGDCDAPEMCTGLSPTCPADAKSRSVCRPKADACDAAEVCDGVSDDCPGDAFALPGIECREAMGLCDLPEACSGDSPACPPDVKSTAECRPASDICDLAEFCDGLSNTCPPDGLKPQLTECRPAAGPCDQAESCTGATPSCPPDVKSFGACRPAVGACDIAEVCDGVSSDCPPDSVEPATLECRPTAGICDLPEFCTGTDGVCPADAKSTAPCRPSDGPCDIADVCDGVSDGCPDNFRPNAEVCRPAAGACDLAEACTGFSPLCPSDIKRLGECRAAVGDCDIAESCNGSSNDCPADRLVQRGVRCRDVAGPCDALELCDGASPECPPDEFLDDPAMVCRPAQGVCDLAESCDGSGPVCPADAKSTAECRPANGDCDVAEVCNGLGNACPADTFGSVDIQCRPAAGPCDMAEFCSGNTSTCPPDAKSTAECRPANGDCDLPESCTGASNECPADGFEVAGVVCRAAAGVCDEADTCTGSDPICPGDAKSTAECRPATGDCDVPEACDGVTDDCPPDTLASAGVECRTALGECDVAETCTGDDATCPADEKSTAECRPATDVCDRAESCNGIGNDCPPDDVVFGGVECRPAAGECDQAEHCNGIDPSCPEDVKHTDVCRASTGACDVTESCDGISNTCPADAVVAAGVECRPAGGECDIAESCNGADPACPADEKRTVECRPAFDICDAVERCDGVTNACPPDRLQPPTVECRSSAGACDPAETCSGSSALCPPDAKSLGICRPVAGVCDIPEFCTGIANDCPTDRFISSLVVCRPAANTCDLVEHCPGDAAACAPDAVADGGTACTDGNMCTEDQCDGLGNCIGSTLCGNGIVDPGCGEECESDTDCSGGGFCDLQTCTCAGMALGARTLSVDGALYSSSSGAGETATASLQGSLTLIAGNPEEDGAAPVVTPAGPFYLFADDVQAEERMCRRISRCEGTVFCNGGTNVDVLAALDSLEQGLICNPDQTPPACQGDECCTNACEGVRIGSGNLVDTFTGINAGVNSGTGAMLLSCQEAAAVTSIGADCTAADYGPDVETTYTTGVATAAVMNECKNALAAATITTEGENFDCTNWTVEDGPGALVFVEPLEEPTSLSPGDCATAGVLADAPPGP